MGTPRDADQDLPGQLQPCGALLPCATAAGAYLSEGEETYHFKGCGAGKASDELSKNLEGNKATATNSRELSEEKGKCQDPSWQRACARVNPKHRPPSYWPGLRPQPYPSEALTTSFCGRLLPSPLHSSGPFSASHCPALPLFPHLPAPTPTPDTLVTAAFP